MSSEVTVRNFPKRSEVRRRRSYRENALPQGPMLVDNISGIVLKLDSFGLIARNVLSFIHFTHGFHSLLGSDLTYFLKLCQQLTFFNQA